MTISGRGSRTLPRDWIPFRSTRYTVTHDARSVRARYGWTPPISSSPEDFPRTWLLKKGNKHTQINQWYNWLMGTKWIYSGVCCTCSCQGSIDWHLLVVFLAGGRYQTVVDNGRIGRIVGERCVDYISCVPCSRIVRSISWKYWSSVFKFFSN